MDDWEGFVKKFNVKLDYIDNSVLDATIKIEKLMKSNILIISGGDPLNLLINLRKTGLDKIFEQFAKKKEFILTDYSAGAYILTLSLDTAKLFNENYPGGKKYKTLDKLKDFKGLRIVDFEIIAHYSTNQYKEIFKIYIESKEGVVRLIADDDYLVINL